MGYLRFDCSLTFSIWDSICKQLAYEKDVATEGCQKFRPTFLPNNKTLFFWNAIAEMNIMTLLLFIMLYISY